MYRAHSRYLDYVGCYIYLLQLIMENKEKKEFSKKEFQELWGLEGYYEPHNNHGVGIEKSCETVLYPFLSEDKDILEIGCGGGAFTERIIKSCKSLTAIDVIKQPERLKSYQKLSYIELPNKNYSCKGVDSEVMDFAFSSGVFCHLPYLALKEYLYSVNRVLKHGGDFVFMLSDWDNLKKIISEEEQKTSKPDDFTSSGHFHQDETTLFEIYDEDLWDIISENMIPDYGSWYRYIHLRKKENNGNYNK